MFLFDKFGAHDFDSSNTRFFKSSQSVVGFDSLFHNAVEIWAIYYISHNFSCFINSLDKCSLENCIKLAKKYKKIKSHHQLSFLGIEAGSKSHLSKNSIVSLYCGLGAFCIRPVHFLPCRNDFGYCWVSSERF